MAIWAANRTSASPALILTSDNILYTSKWPSGPLEGTAPAQPSSLHQIISFTHAGKWQSLLGWCYKTVDSATTASRYGFCSDKLSLHRKTNIVQIMTETVHFYYFYLLSSEVLKQDHYMTHYLSNTNAVLWYSRCKIRRYVAAPMYSCIMQALVSMIIFLQGKYFVFGLKGKEVTWQSSTDLQSSSVPNEEILNLSYISYQGKASFSRK